MRVSINLVMAMVTLLFGLLLVPRAAVADTYANCPGEPASNVPIALGETFSGTNCNLYTDGDVDSFVFKGTTGETYQLALAINGAAPSQICLTLYDPTATQVFSGCTNVPYSAAVVTNQKLTMTGTYTIAITEVSTATLNYGLSLQRLYPFPADAQPVPKLAQSVSGDITPLTDTDDWTFPSATTGTYRVTATMTSSNSQLCMTVYLADGSSGGSGCTNIPYSNIIQIDFKPTKAQAGTTMPFLSVAGYDSTATYNLEVSCLVGTCPPFHLPPPACVLTDALTYASGTLTMDFTLGAPYATTWNAWLTSGSTAELLWSVSEPVNEPPITIPKTQALSPSGKVGILSTLTTPTAGITCSSWALVNTGKP